MMARLGNFKESAYSTALRVCDHLLNTRLFAFDYALSINCHVIPPSTSIPKRHLLTLSLGTKFIPADHRFVAKSTADSLDMLYRDLGWAQLFGWTSTGEPYPIFRNRVSEPPSLEPRTAKFLAEVTSRLQPALNHLPSYQSYFARAISAFTNWAAGRFIVKPADKNLGLVVMPKDFYMDLCFKYLSTACKVVAVSETDSIEHCKEQAKLLVIRNHGRIDDEVVKWHVKYLKKVKVLPEFYILPKLHKDPISQRPIVAAHTDAYSGLSRWLGKMLLPVVQRLPAYIRDSHAVCYVLDQLDADDSCVFLTFDVESMYPSMKLETTITGLKFAIELAYGSRTPSWLPMAIGIVHLLFKEFYFKFNNTVYQQSNGIAMGTNAAPLLASCYLAPIEQQLFGDKLCNYYGRYIDDGLAITSSLSSAHNVMTRLSQSDVRFTHVISADRAIFLDLEVYKPLNIGLTQRFGYRTFRKAMNRYLYIPSFSAHSPSGKISWIYAEALRLWNTTTDKRIFMDQIRFFVAQLRARGYSVNLIDKAFALVPHNVFVNKHRASDQLPLADNSGQAFALPPPHIFRAPYAPCSGLNFGNAVYPGLTDLIDYLDSTHSLEAWLANPNPLASSPIVISHTLAPSLLARIQSAQRRF